MSKEYNHSNIALEAILKLIATQKRKKSKSCKEFFRLGIIVIPFQCSYFVKQANFSRQNDEQICHILSLSNVPRKLGGVGILVGFIFLTFNLVKKMNVNRSLPMNPCSPTFGRSKSSVNSINHHQTEQLFRQRPKWSFCTYSNGLIFSTFNFVKNIVNHSLPTYESLCFYP